MKIMCVGSSSAGNCYLFKAEDGKTLIVECGVSMMEIKNALNFNLKCAEGCLVTHRHKDHCKSIVDVAKCGIDVYAIGDVFASVQTDSPFFNEIVTNRQYHVGDFTVLAFIARHDVPCVSFCIKHPECGWILFMTDSVTLTSNFQGLQHIMIECNYADDILQENIDNGTLHKSQRERLMISHCELGTTMKILGRLDLSSVKDIMLLHLSHQNSDPKRFQQEVSLLTGKMTYVATPGLEVDYSLY